MWCAIISCSALFAPMMNTKRGWQSSNRCPCWMPRTGPMARLATMASPRRTERCRPKNSRAKNRTLWLSRRVSRPSCFAFAAGQPAPRERSPRPVPGEGQPPAGDTVIIFHKPVGGLSEAALSRFVSRAQRTARLLGHSPAEEIKILALHGLLHLAGYDHERDNGRMAREEFRLRKTLQLPMALLERSADPPRNRRKAKPSPRRTASR